MTGVATDDPVVPREDLLSIDPPSLLAGSCDACGQLSFPRERYCAHCGGPDTRLVPLATRGTIYSWTIARFAPPGYAGEVPFGVGVVELDDGIRVTSTLVADPLESLRVGATVAFRLLQVDTADGVGGPVISWAYGVDE